MEPELTLRIVLDRPPAGVDFALQKGRGSAYQTVQKQRSEGKSLQFQFTAGVKPGPGFTGPFIQGKPGERFVYLDIGTYAGQTDSCWSRRLKAPLSGITKEMIASRSILEARIPGTGKDGGPACATVKSIVWRKVKK